MGEEGPGTKKCTNIEICKRITTACDIQRCKWKECSVSIDEVGSTPLITTKSGYDPHKSDFNLHFILKGSDDCIAKGKMDDFFFFLIVMEVKCKVTPRTGDYKKEQRLLNLIQLRICARGTRFCITKYFILDCTDKNVSSFIHKPEELIQILHCTSLYELDYWCLVVGDSFGNVITFFSDKIHKGYKRCMD